MGCKNPSKGLMPPDYLLLGLLLMLASNLLLPGVQLVMGSSRLLGCLPLALGLAMNLLADRAFKQAQTPVNPYAPTNTLITWSVFRWSRNPMYLGFILIMIGIAWVLGSLTPFLFPLLFTLIIRGSFIKPEEAKLEKEFPETWRVYTTQTRRWI